jgi:hypothetical protein
VLQIDKLITTVPQSLLELWLEIPSDLCQLTLFLIGLHLTALRYLRVEGNYEVGYVTENSLITLEQNCTYLKKIEIFSKVSVNEIVFESLAYRRLFLFPPLGEISVIFKEPLIDILIEVLDDSLRKLAPINKIEFFEHRRWLDERMWLSIETRLSKLRERFPTVVFSLVDI